MPDIIWLINFKFANAAYQALYVLSGGCLKDEYVEFKSPVSLNGVLLLTPLAPSLAVCCQWGQVSFNFAWILKMDHNICKELIKNSLY
jgi:hypothetical protein